MSAPLLLALALVLGHGDLSVPLQPIVNSTVGPAFDEIGTIYQLISTDDACRTFQPDGDVGLYYLGTLSGYEVGERVRVIGNLGGPTCANLPYGCPWLTGCVTTTSITRLVGTPYCTSFPNSSSWPATIEAAGRESLAANDFELLVQNAPSGQPGIFFAGNLQMEITFGDGLRCVSGPVGGFYRLYPYAHADQTGAMRGTVDLQSGPFAAALSPGSTWNFQAWYRDPLAGGAGFNLTNAVSVNFAP